MHARSEKRSEKRMSPLLSPLPHSVLHWPVRTHPDALWSCFYVCLLAQTMWRNQEKADNEAKTPRK